MLEGIEALIALERTGTISEAAAQLRLTQSAVTKRLQALQNEVNFKLIEPDGRRVKLTQQAQDFLLRARPLVTELKSLKQFKPENGITRYSIALADSIAATWGPKLIKQASRKIKNIEFDLHVHRSTLVEENVKLGRYDLGLCISLSSASSGNLFSTRITEEPLVFVYNKFDEDAAGETSKVITIEKNSGTWRNMEDRLLKNSKVKSADFVYVESFAAISQMVKEGFGNGIIPLGLAQHLNIPKKGFTAFSPAISREIKLISRKSIATQDPIQEFTKQLTELSQNIF
ncbi:MAG: LysR family transcriptional regulator [Pseudobdellovibrio sp.]|nr:LysR family transcriptional regulator [Pseudobdellovibrio sp.]